MMEAARQQQYQYPMVEVLQVNFRILFVWAVFFCTAGTGTLQAQIAGEPEFMVITREDGEVYLYHTTRLPLGYSYNIYRRVAGENESQNLLLNPEPLGIASSEMELRSMLGSLYWELRTTLTSASDNREILYVLRNDQSAGMMAAFLYEPVAMALGRLWIDRDTGSDNTVIYTIEVLDEFDEPIGESFTYQTELVPSKPETPSGLSLSHEGRTITLEWNYPQLSDHTLYFNIYRLLDNGNRIKMNTDIIIRNTETDSFEHELTVARTGLEYTFAVEAVDISGQPGDLSEEITIDLIDNLPPQFLNGVEAFINDDGFAVITWPMATETKATGYNIYSADSSEENAPLQLLTPEPLPVNRISYVDSLAGASGNSELWFYRVTVVSDTGLESLVSNAAMVHLPVFEAPPPAYSIHAEMVTDREVLLTWEAPEMPDSFVTWVIMRRDLSRRATDVAVRITPDSLLVNRFLDDGGTELGLNEGTEYEYLIASQDGDKFTSEFVSTTITIPKVTPPDPPGNLRAFNEDGYRVRLNWNPVSDPFAEFYSIYRSQQGGEPELIQDLSLPALVYSDESVERGQIYQYTITATDSFGNSSVHSLPDTVFVRSFSTPRTVRNVRAEELEEGGVRVWWEPVPDSDLAGYRVFRSSIPTGVFEDITEELIGETEFLDLQGTRGMWYRVRAYDTSTNESRVGEAAQAW